MAMKELATFTLNAKQIKEACESFVGRRIHAETELATAEVNPESHIVVRVSKRRVRKAKQ